MWLQRRFHFLRQWLQHRFHFLRQWLQHRFHFLRQWNWPSSVEPASAVVDDVGSTVVAMRSK